MGYGNKELTISNILGVISEYDIFKYYCQNFKTLGVGFKSELYKDSQPSCFIYNNKGRLRYKDFGSLEHHDCFSYVQKKYNLTFLESLQVISNDFRLSLGTPIQLPPSMIAWGEIGLLQGVDIDKPPTIIRVSIRPFNSTTDKYFWRDQYRLNCRDLKEANIFALDWFWINDRCYKAEEHCYGYYFGINQDNIHQWKIYQPYGKGHNSPKRGKWYSNCRDGHLQGMDLLPWFGERLIITKSYKDVLVLKKLNYCAVAPHGEGHRISGDQIEQLKKRFNRIDVLYDNDKAGIKASIALSSEHSLGNITLPSFANVKDVSDFVKYKGYDELSKFLQSYYT